MRFDFYNSYVNKLSTHLLRVCKNGAGALRISYSVRIVLVLVTALTSIQFTYALVTGPGAAWQYVRKITLSPATPAADFQVKMTLTATQYTNMNAAGNDLRFYDINNNLCNYWIETWNNTGTSTIWVKVFTSGATSLYMYYGNAAAPAASNGASVFDFFDDFTTPLGTGWAIDASGGSVTQSGTTVTLSNTNGGNVAISNSSAFTPSSTSFLLETKHSEAGYNRNRFYASTGTFAGSPIFDYGYFSTAATSQTASKIFWNGFLPAGSSTLLSDNTDYLTRWQITNGSTYNWYTFNYNTGVALDATARNTTVAANIRFITIQVTEVAATSTTVDWVRVRKFTATEPVATMGSQVANLAAIINAQTNVICTGKSTGNATVTVTGGATPYSYSWNSSPTQSTQTANNLPVGSYIVTVTDNIGLSTTASVIITLQPVVKATATYNNINCFNATDGTITITGSNGTGGYMFSIDNGLNYQGGATFINLSPGSYKPRVKDSNGCESKSVQ